MLDRYDPWVRQLTSAGFTVAGHVYLQPGQSKYLAQATHPAVGTLSGRSDRSLEDALRALERELIRHGILQAREG